MDERRRALREMLKSPGLTLAPGVTNAFYAKLAEKAGFELLFTTGAGIANTVLGVPDLGLTTMNEVIDVTRHIADATTLPVVADGDTGYGNHVNVMRTTREMERAGVAGFFIEDQVSPKKCGHFEGKMVVPAEEMVQKIVAARRARTDPEMVLIARTDAIAVEGLQSALQRARLYVAAGADVIFIEAPRTREEMEAIPRNVPAPCLVNLVEGGKTPVLPARDLEQMGFKIAVYANMALRVAATSVARAFETLRREGTSSSLVADMLEWDERQETVGLSYWRRVDLEIADEARRLTDSAAETAGRRHAV